MFQRHRALLLRFISECMEEGLGDASTKKVFNLLTNPDTACYVYVELAAIAKFAGPLADACYTNEGDGQLVFDMYEQCTTLMAKFPEDCFNSNEGGDRAIDLDAAIAEGLVLAHKGKSVAKLAAAREARAALDVEQSLAAVAHQVERRFPRRKGAEENVKATARAVMGATAQKKALAELAKAKEEQRQVELVFETEVAERNAVIVDTLSRCPPLDPAAWHQHIRHNMEPMVIYLHNRLNTDENDGGNRQDALELFKAAQVGRPTFVSKSTTR